MPTGSVSFVESTTGAPSAPESHVILTGCSALSNAGITTQEPDVGAWARLYPQTPGPSCQTPPGEPADGARRLETLYHSHWPSACHVNALPQACGAWPRLWKRRPCSFGGALQRSGMLPRTQAPSSRK